MIAQWPSDRLPLEPDEYDDLQHHIPASKGLGC